MLHGHGQIGSYKQAREIANLTSYAKIEKATLINGYCIIHVETDVDYNWIPYGEYGQGQTISGFKRSDKRLIKWIINFKLGKDEEKWNRLTNELIKDFMLIEQNEA